MQKVWFDFFIDNFVLTTFYLSHRRRQLASKIMSRPVDQITGEERNKAKVICLGEFCD